MDAQIKFSLNSLIEILLQAPQAFLKEIHQLSIYCIFRAFVLMFFMEYDDHRTEDVM